MEFIDQDLEWSDLEREYRRAGDDAVRAVLGRFDAVTTGVGLKIIIHLSQTPGSSSSSSHGNGGSSSSSAVNGAEDLQMTIYPRVKFAEREREREHRTKERRCSGSVGHWCSCDMVYGWRVLHDIALFSLPHLGFDERVSGT